MAWVSYTATHAQVDQEDQDEGDTALVIDESTTILEPKAYSLDLGLIPFPSVSDESSCNQFPVDLSFRPPPIQPSWEPEMPPLLPSPDIHPPDSLRYLLQKPTNNSTNQISSFQSSPVLPLVIESSPLCQKMNGKKLRKRALSECMRELETFENKNKALRAKHDRLEHKVKRLKSFYIVDYLQNASHACVKREEQKDLMKIETLELHD